MAAAVLTVAAGPAGAIETATFGLDPSGAATRTALHEQVRPGHRVEDAVVVWNKTSQPLVLRLSVSGAVLGPDGKVELGGSAGAAGWVHAGESTVSLPPHGRATVGIRVVAPRTMPRGTATAAVVAEPATASGPDIAVVQRVAVMVYVSAPPGSPLKAALGWAVWIAVLLLIGAVVLLMVRGREPQRSRPAT